MSKLHDDAVSLIKSKLQRKFRRKAEPKAFRIDGSVPDIIFQDKHGKLVVVEIGKVGEYSILRYLRSPNIKRILWYSKKGELIGKWIPKKFGENYNCDFPTIFTKELMETLEEEEIRARDFDRLYFQCPICRIHKNFFELRTERYAAGYRIICADCEKS